MSKEQRMEVAARMSNQLSLIFIKHSMICLREHRNPKSGSVEQLQYFVISGQDGLIILKI